MTDTEMSILEEYRNTWWDMYKDAYNIRPRGINTDGWSVSDFEEEFEYLEKVIDRENAERKEMEDEAIRRFEILVTKTINTGAADRNTAVRWILDDERDVEHFEWQNSLPFGYLKEFY